MVSIRAIFSGMANQKRSTFNPKKEVSLMARIENDEGDVLLVRQTAGQKLWTLRPWLTGGSFSRHFQ